MALDVRNYKFFSFAEDMTTYLTSDEIMPFFPGAQKDEVLRLCVCVELTGKTGIEEVRNIFVKKNIMDQHTCEVIMETNGHLRRCSMLPEIRQLI